MTVALEQEVFDKLYREFRPRVLAICRQMLGSLEQAEETVNDVFARLPSAVRIYDPAQSFARWISRVATNYCVDLLRRRRAEHRVVEPASPALPEPAASVRSPLSELLSKEEASVLHDALFCLPERYFVPLVMHFFSDLSYNQIAETLGTTRATVAVLIFRGKQKFATNPVRVPCRLQGNPKGTDPRRRVLRGLEPESICGGALQAVLANRRTNARLAYDRVALNMAKPPPACAAPTSRKS